MYGLYSYIIGDVSVNNLLAAQKQRLEGQRNYRMALINLDQFNNTIITNISISKSISISKLYIVIFMK